MIAETIKSVCQLCGCPELADKIVVEFNNRFTRKMGDAQYNYRGGFHKIRFSGPLWPRATEEQRKETVVHETCHIVARHLYQHVQSHGDIWQSLMRKCGYQPHKYHTVNRDGLRRRQDRYTYKCECGREHQITRNRLTKMRNGHRYKCGICRRDILEHKIVTW